MRKLCLLWIMVLPNVAWSQFSLTPEVSFSTFNMGALKDFQQSFISQTHLPMKQVAGFPGYFGGGLVVAYNLPARITVGVHGGYTSSGARADYEDYSGLARYDQKAKCFYIGPYFKVQMNKSQAWPLLVGVRGSSVYSRVDMDYQLTVGTSSTAQSWSYFAWNYGVRPEISLQRKISRLLLQANLGYEIQTHGKLYSTSDHTSYLNYNHGTDVTAEWDGLRFSLGAVFFLSKKQ